MKNWKLPPKNQKIARYVECYWFLEKEIGDLSHQQPKLNPDPAAHFIIAANHQQYHYEHDSSIQKGSGCHWIFPHRQSFVMDHTNPFCIIGIKFKVGALYALGQVQLQFALDKIQQSDITKLLPMQSIQFEGLLNNAAQHSQSTVEAIDELLLSWISQSEEDRHSELTRKVLPLLDISPVSEIGKALHCSQRTVERSFLKVTHLTLKQCKSMNQLEDILNFLYNKDKDAINWSDVAYKFGFSDQPHLIRYLKSTIGDTPTNYTSKRDLTIDTYGDFEVS